MRTFLKIAAVAYIVYVAIALLVITPVLNLLPHWYVKDTYARELKTGWVLFNPFKISLDVNEAELTDTEGKAFAAFSDASVNLSTESLWHSGWVFDAVALHNVDLEVVRETETTFNFSDLLASDTEEPPEEEPEDSGEIPGVTVRDLDISAHTIVFSDLAREKAYTSEWNGLSIHVKNLSTVLEEGQPYIVDVEGENGGKLHWEGTVSIPNSSSEGLLSLSNVSLLTVWRFAEPWVRFELKDGRLAVDGKYAVNWADTFSYQVSDGHIGLSAIDIAPKNPEQLTDTALSLDSLEIRDVSLDSVSTKVSIDTVAIDGLQVATWLEESELSLQPLFALDFPTDSAAAQTQEPQQDDDDSAQWSVVLNKATMSNSGLDWRSKITDPAQLAVRPIEASVENITWPLSGDTGLALKLTVNDKAVIEGDGILALAEGNGSINYKLDGLPLAWFNPNLPEPLKATITGGEAGTEGQVALQEFSPTTINLNAIVRDFSAAQLEAETMLTGFDAVRVSGLSVDMQAHTLVLEKLSIESYTGRLHIHEDGSVNASNIWKEELGDEAQQVADDLTQDKPWSFSIPTIQISESEIDFMDQSLPIQFRTVIGELEGEVLDLSSEPGAAAKVDIKGSVDGYAPVELNGKAAPFASPPDLDLKLSFDGVDMARLSPYTGTYAGYAIERGLLDLNLQYALKDNHLKGDNSIRIDKLKLGEKVESDKAVDLPLELALAILTDSNGVIDMQVPVSGDVDNPGFELGGVISKAIINIITKAITAPFKLLAGLVDSEEDLQSITFSSGSTRLNDASKEKLNQLVTALQQRPKLSLVITGRLNLDADRTRLQKNALKVQLLEAGVSNEEIKSKGPDWETEINERYLTLPGAIADAETAPTPVEQYEQVTEGITIPDEQLLELAQERAAVVKRYLVNESALPPERAVVGTATLDEKANAFSGVELSIES